MRLAHASHVLLTVALLTAVASCGRDEAPTDPLLRTSSPVTQLIDPPRYLDETSNPPPRSTPTELLTAYFEQVYSRRDSVLYAAMLDRQFQFQFLPADADSLRWLLGEDNFWKKRLDLKSTGAMFRDSSVTSILLNILPQSNVPYPGDDCDGCREIFSIVALRVTLLREGEEPLIFAVDSWQDFIVKQDPIEPSKWILFRQFDVALSAASKAAADTVSSVEPVSWGS
jgi:hypothetical protein